MVRIEQRGFTLVEASTVLAIIAVVVSMATSTFSQLVQRRVTDGVAAEVAADLQFARTEAVARNQTVRVSFGSNEAGGRCYVIHTGPASACQCRNAGAAQCAAGAAAIKQLNLRADRGSTVSANRASMAYEPLHGTVTPTATVKVTGPGGHVIHHVVNILGRVHTCTPSAMPGYAACS